MDYRKEFNAVMQKTVNMALATSVENVPNVRIVNFCYDIAAPGVVYFATCRDNLKTIEFAKNSTVAFSTIPAEGITHVRTQGATIKKSRHSIKDLKNLFLAQIPDFSETFEQIGDELDVYEVHIKSAKITLGFDQQGIISF